MSATVAPSKNMAQPKQNGPIHYPLWFGGSASCFAACVTHPLDLLKVRLQTQPHDGSRRNMGQMFMHVLKSDGVPGLYKGLSASLLRQITYSTTRFGVYEELKETFTSAKEKPSFAALIAMSSTSGFLGGIVGNPADILNVRMQNDASLPAAERRNYKNAVDGLVRMAREEGLASLFRGVWPNSTRAVLMTASQLASYDLFKKELSSRFGMGDNLYTHFSASLMAGFVATTVCSPVDVVKTRVMSAKTHEGLMSLLTRITAKEGLGWMFKGWVPSFIRLGPHTIATFMFLEQHKKIYRSWKGLDV
ncbi:Hypothetical protein R9X50_00710600 [Acrodontium crateriforme]|uniref:Mitochondrial carrier n=1 Tax=Acrodontium crateriforme TaxID=150365 RepID=A0AAQ3MDP7_9PEZI|nr:Hypothetical protein R9X50_00710600 [Acrodontium crateriforme]